jgi:hypothetical protein
MRYFFAMIFGVLEVLILGPARALESFILDTILKQGIVGEIQQDYKDTNWRREFLAQKELEKNRRNPFLSQNETKTMQWGRSSMKRKSKP